MLLGRPWLRDAKVAHDWKNYTGIIQGNGTFKTILVTKHLGIEVKRPKMLLCYVTIMVSLMKRRISHLLQN
jgi:hypothetical protein